MKASMRCCRVAMHFTGPPIKLRASFLKRWASCQLVPPSRPPLRPIEVLSVLQFFLERSEPLLQVARRTRKFPIGHCLSDEDQPNTTINRLWDVLDQPEPNSALRQNSCM